MQDLNLTVIYGSHRQQRKGIRAAKFVVEQLSRRCKVEFVDTLETGLPILDLRYFEYEKGTAPDNLESAAQIMDKTDAFVIVTGEYNRGLPPGLSNFIDHFNSEYTNKALGIVSYSSGAFGGVRAAEHLRSVAANLGLIALPAAYAIPTVQDAFDENGQPTGDRTADRFERFMDKLLPFARVMTEARQQGRF